ncbi:MAG: hypothetical protein FWD46_05920 [Cystobacterineae bacterium]|nr:hypothetical protein [Cystobacterineae bacterium]
MRFLRLTLFALFWVAIGLGLGIVPMGGTTVWQKLCGSFQHLQKQAPAETASPTPRPPLSPPASKTSNKAVAVDAGQVPSIPIESYAAEERASIDKLIRGNPPAH